MYFHPNEIIGVLKDINHSLNSFGISDLIALFGLFVIIVYTYYTYRTTKAIEKTLLEDIRPIASCNLISGKNYYSP